MRRGFNMFSIFVGVAMIVIAMAVGVYAYQSQQHRLEIIQPRTFSYETASIADFVRDDAIATLTNRMRQEFQDFFATQILTPPDTVWNDDSAFITWFRKDLAASDTFTSWFAHRLALELQMYQDVRIGDYTISVDADEKTMQSAIKHGSSFLMFPDGTFAYVLDTEKLSPSDYAALPKLVLTKGFQESSFPVFPRKKWSVYVPLRVYEAYKVARKARFAVMSHLDDYKLAIGACTSDCPVCAVYDMRGTTPVRIYPDESKLPECFLSTEEFLPSSEKEQPVSLGSVEHPCTNQYLDLNWAKDVLNVPNWVVDTKIPCFTGEKSNQYNIDEKAFALYNILEYRLAQQARHVGDNVRIDLDPASFKTYQTMKVCSQRAISVSAFVSSQIPGMDWLLKKIGNAIGLDILAQGTVGLSPCQEDGYLSCSAPTKFTVVTSWTDPDLNYSVKAEPATYHFRINLSGAFKGIDAMLTGLQEEANNVTQIQEQKPIKVDQDKANKLDKDCVNRLTADCMAQYYAAYAECNATPDVKNDMELALQEYYQSNPKNPLWNVCKMNNWPGGPPAPCKTFYIATATEVPAAWDLSLASPEMENWKQSKVLDAYFSSFVPAVQKYAKDENALIAAGKITDTKCISAINGLLSTFGDKGYCATWGAMRNTCLSLSMRDKEIYPQCPAAKHRAYSTFWLHVFSEPVGTCSYGKQSLTGK